jgi:GR25 family glycosyltransferase involved in LPS biosynthesis
MQLQKRSLLKGPFISFHLILSVLLLLLLRTLPISTYKNNPHHNNNNHTTTSNTNPGATKTPKKHTPKKTHKLFASNSLVSSLSLSLSRGIVVQFGDLCGGGGRGPAVVGKCRR